MRKIFFIVVLIFLVISLIRNIGDYYKNISFYDETKHNLTTAQEINKSLGIRKQSNLSDFEIEKNLRNKQSLVRENEYMIIIPSPSPTPTPYVGPTEAPYRQWVGLFFE
ncbi:MAG: hypothetical protein WA061_04045 [Microgenomates group bacterium]